MTVTPAVSPTAPPAATRTGTATRAVPHQRRPAARALTGTAPTPRPPVPSAAARLSVSAGPAPADGRDRARTRTRRRAMRWAGLDVAAAVVGLGAASAVAHLWTSPPPLWEQVSPATAATGWALVPLLWAGLLAGAQQQRATPPTARGQGVRGVSACGLLLVVCMLGAAAVLGAVVDPVELLVLAGGATAASAGARLLAGAWRAATRARTRVVLLGHRRAVADLAAELGRRRDVEVVGVCLHRVKKSARSAFGVPVHGGLDDVRDAVTASGAEAVVALPCRHLDRAALRRLAWDLEPTGTQLLVGTGLLDVATARARLLPAGVPLMHVRPAELRGWRRGAKDVLERSAALVLLVLLAPLVVVLAVGVRLDSPGPAFFRQVRVGRDGRPFTLLKLRTMTTAAEALREALEGASEVDGPLFKVRRDPRVTRWGQLLRTWSLDEVPQLLNVVLGDMALVGPRPPLPAEVAAYDDVARRRLAVKPGLTGLWQVSGRSDLTWEETVRLDLDYVDNWSPARDLAILARTPVAVLTHRGAY